MIRGGKLLTRLAWSDLLDDTADLTIAGGFLGGSRPARPPAFGGDDEDVVIYDAALANGYSV